MSSSFPELVIRRMPSSLHQFNLVSSDHHQEDYPFAELYNGPRPAFIPPKALALHNIDLFLNRVCCVPPDRPASTPPSQSNNGLGSDFASSFDTEKAEILPCTEEEYYPTTYAPSSDQKSSSDSSSNGFSHDSEAQTWNIKNNNKKHRKGACHRCSKGNRLQDKESCLVCNAKYCAACIFDAMGSMPEGRKCLTCLGRPVDESRLPSVGDPSKLLCRLLTTLEIELIMKAERECPTNQLRSEQVWVNGKQLSKEEFVNLHQCNRPPSRLKPGKYWYDAHSGYWGKIGQRPDEIISCDLKVGGRLHEKASNGRTMVYINEREITKIELKMLQLAGIPCPPNTRLWLTSEGNVSPEGQTKCLGNIWNKGPARFLSPWFSLPLPYDTKPRQSRMLPAYLGERKPYKILLLGHADSGTNTIFKQVRFLYGGPLTMKEQQTFKSAIQSCIFKYMSILLEACERFCNAETPSTSTASGDAKRVFGEKNLYTIDDRLRNQADWFLDTMEQQTLHGASHKYAHLLAEIWKDPAIQATYERRNELPMLPDFADYFLDRVVEILSNEYEPSEMDILHAETVTDSPCISEVEFSQFENYVTSGPYTETLQKPFSEVRCSLINVTGDIMADGFRLFRMFENVDALIFCVALDAYDQTCSNTKTDIKNKMILNRELLQTVIKHPNFQKIPIILFLNKFNSLEEKIQSVPLNRCQWFSDFNPVKSSQQSLAQDAYTYIAHKFKKHFEVVSGSGRVFTFQIKTWEQSSVKDALQYVREILKWEELKTKMCSTQVDSLYSSTDTEINYSSSSYSRRHKKHPAAIGNRKNVQR